MIRCSRLIARKNEPGVSHLLAPETTPVKFTTHLLNTPRKFWYNGMRHQFIARYRERNWLDTWPSKKSGWEKGRPPVLKTNYSPAALKEALMMIPPEFHTSYVSRPPQRIKAQSEGIVGRWYTNYWTLHSIKYQCSLAEIPWEHGERIRPTTNYDQPYHFVDFEESKAIRDYRSRFINVNRSMVGMSKRIKESEEVMRFAEHKRHVEKFWSDRKVLVNRVKAMSTQGLLDTPEELPIKTMNIRAFSKGE
eukprot:Tbor_TRINITY_DN3651_c0_g1::TRINITY_DN3651_c0_g1_i1::g.223::m.223